MWAEGRPFKVLGSVGKNELDVTRLDVSAMIRPAVSIFGRNMKCEML